MQPRKTFLVVALGGLAAVWLGAAMLAAQEKRPNFILILADDMGFSDIGCYGGEIQTPHLDQLAREGMRFVQFYNNAKCTTTRATLLSGMYPRGQGNQIPLDIPTLAERLRQAGYHTAMSGKWHLGSRPPQRPIDRGFEEFYGLMDGAVNYFNPALPDPPYKGGRVRNFFHNDRRIESFPADFYTTDAFTDHAIATLRKLAASGQPFFLHLAFTAPHYPLHAWPEDIAKYRGTYRQGWEALRRQRHARQIAMGIVDPRWPLAPTDSKAYDWNKANQDWEDLRMAVYAAMVDRMDQNIGRLLAVLSELGLAQDTVVMFLSDNGGCSEEPGGRDMSQQPGTVESYTAVGPAWGWAQNAPFRRYKSWVHEGGISTPLIVRWPGQVPPGTLTSQLGHILDVAPTLLELAGVDPAAPVQGKAPPPLEGQSLACVLRGGTRPPPAELCWEWAGNCAIRRGRWKLVWDTLNPQHRWELYDIEVDRTELNDLAGELPQVVAELSEAYARWAKTYGRRLPGEKAAPAGD
jgi:arylsulfatase